MGIFCEQTQSLDILQNRYNLKPSKHFEKDDSESNKYITNGTVKGSHEKTGFKYKKPKNFMIYKMPFLVGHTVYTLYTRALDILIKTVLCTRHGK